jgi:phthiocerol/phenolphthiocerol synthesis type-I polyketide synthase D
MPGYRWQRQRCWAEGLSEVTQADAIVTEASRPAIVESLLPARVSGSVIPPWDRSSDGSPAALQSLRDRLGACGPAEREALVRETLRGELAELLLVPADGTIDETPLSHLGIDSMSALRLRARSEQLFGSSPSVAQLLSGASLANVARHICAAMAAREEAPPPASAIGSPERSHTSTYLPQNYASLSDTNAWIAQITDEQVEQELLALLDEQASVA